MNPRLSILQSLVNKTIHQTDPVGSCATFANEQEVIYTAFNIPSTTSAVTDWDSHCELQVVDHMSKYDKPIDLYITLSPCNFCSYWQIHAIERDKHHPKRAFFEMAFQLY